MQVGFGVTLDFMNQERSSAPTKSSAPTSQASSPPSSSAYPSHLPSVKASTLPSGEPSTNPTVSVSPTVLRDESIDVCLCDQSFKCVDTPLFSTSPVIKACLLATPHTYIIDETVFVALSQGADIHALVRNDEVDETGFTTIEEQSERRRRVITTTVPSRFFRNPRKGLMLNGMGRLWQNGTAESRERAFSIALPLVSEPSGAPSSLPSVSSQPSWSKGRPTTSPTQSRVPSVPPSTSVMPTEEQTIGMEFCPCDGQDSCLDRGATEPVNLTHANRLIRICLRASPSNAEIQIPHVQCNKQVALETQLQEKHGAVIAGTLSSDFFDFGLRDDVDIIGIAEIFVQQSKKRSRMAFSVQYVLQPLTLPPTGAPSISAAPSIVPLLGVQACHCNSNNVCLENIVAFYKTEDIRICIRSTPSGAKLIQIVSFLYKMENTIETIFVNGKRTAEVTDFNETAGFQMIQSRVTNEDFFRQNASLYNITAEGTVLVEPELGDGAKSEGSFSVKLQIFSRTSGPTVRCFGRIVKISQACIGLRSSPMHHSFLGKPHVECDPHI